MHLAVVTALCAGMAYGLRRAPGRLDHRPVHIVFLVQDAQALLERARDFGGTGSGISSSRADAAEARAHVRLD